MNKKKYNRFALIAALATQTFLGACSGIGFDNPAILTNEQAIDKIEDLGYKLSTSSVQTTFSTTTSSAGVHFSLLADQTTNTNGNSSWWEFALEPRLRLNNNTSYRGAVTWNTFYNNFYQANLDATLALNIIENEGKPIIDGQGEDRTADCRIAAYFAKGVSQGYLGVIFDRGIIVDDVDVSERAFPNSYKELIENGIKHIEKAVELAEASANFRFDFLSGIILSKAEFIALSNSLAARILSSQARDEEEARALGAAHWNKVIAFAQKGVSGDYILPTTTGGYYNQLVSLLVQRNADGSGWLPPDIKIPYLADESGQTPNYYPQTGILPPISSLDERFDDYFGYTTSFGILMESRGRGLFTNYYRKRWYNASNTLNVPGAQNPFFLAEELRLIEAEALYWLDDYAGAAALLNAPFAARKSKGLLADVGAEREALRRALHYEYAIEIDAAGGAFVPFTFMRRNDLLIGGTPTQYPVPQLQAELANIDVYTFGGKDYFGEKGNFGETVTAANKGWKPSE
ncbi:hypothetical protein [Olivibacter sitiensis]|uniref:hypothetical protein n=1 Tax=Olivibacter sitiensis TaxID=376470 RepID=UPI0004282DD3|nr:hypothetical protein [Olivibacter sitiensis]